MLLSKWLNSLYVVSMLAHFFPFVKSPVLLQELTSVLFCTQCKHNLKNLMQADS